MRPTEPVFLLGGMALAAEFVAVVKFNRRSRQAVQLVEIFGVMTGRALHRGSLGMNDFDVPM